MEHGFLKQIRGFSTKAVHAAQEPEQWNSKAIVAPITLSTTFKQNTPGEGKFQYGRNGNPSRDVLERHIASLDNGKYGFCFASGNGAASIVAGLVNANEHVICGDSLYGGTNQMFYEVLKRQSSEITFVDICNEKKIEDAIRENTKLMFIETPTNPVFKVGDIEKISKITKNHNIILAVDNTFLTSYFQRPLDLGADIVMYSMSKYMNGHADVLMGALVINDETLRTRINYLQKIMGVVPSPFDCGLVTRSLKTLPIRMEKHMKNGLKVAKFLETHPAVEKVLHPGLPSHPQHELSKKQCYGHSGILAFYIKGGLKESKTFLQSVKVFTLAGSLGACESLLSLPCVMSHASLSNEQRSNLGITENLIRVSVGLEDADDLIEDLDAALRIAVSN